MKNLIEYILTHLVDKPEDVVITEAAGDYPQEVVFKIKVSPEDMGKVIGKNGSRIKAIRKVVNILALKTGQKPKLMLEE